MRDQLPEECERELDYPGLLDTLALLEGEEVLLDIGGLSSGNADGRATRIGAFGVLRHASYTWADLWAVGDGGRMLLYEPDFVSASLVTFDGNDFFRVTACFGAVTFQVADESAGGDEFDR